MCVRNERHLLVAAPNRFNNNFQQASKVSNYHFHEHEMLTRILRKNKITVKCILHMKYVHKIGIIYVIFIKQKGAQRITPCLMAFIIKLISFKTKIAIN